VSCLGNSPEDQSPQGWGFPDSIVHEPLGVSNGAGEKVPVLLSRVYTILAN